MSSRARLEITVHIPSIGHIRILIEGKMTFHPWSKQMIFRCKIYFINPSLSSPPATLSTITCNKIFAVVTHL